MSKKHYQAVARAIHEVITEESVEPSTREMHVLSTLRAKLGDIFKADNSAFDRERFIEACTTGTTRGMRK